MAAVAYPPSWLLQTPSQIAVAVASIVLWPVTLIFLTFHHSGFF
jgi:hypothetical protein